MTKNLQSAITIIAAIILQQVFSLHANAQAPCDSLVSPCLDTYSVNGYYLELEAGAANTLIKSFSTITQNSGTRDVDIYYKTGSYVGFETNSSAWTLINTATGFNPLDALSCPIPQTEIPVNVNICIPSGQVYSFYIMRSTGSGTFEAHKLVPEGQSSASDGSLTLYSGKGTQDFSPFQGSFLRDSLTFQGSIDYSCGCAVTSANQINVKNDFVAYPVPANDHVIFIFNAFAEREIAINIFDITGRIIKTENKQLLVGKNQIAIDVSTLPSGVYSFRIIDGNNSGDILNKGIFIKE